MNSAQLSRTRDAADLPFYCRPVALFFTVWAIMLAAFQLRISYTSYPEDTLPLLLFVAAALPFLAGYATLRLAYKAIDYTPRGSRFYRVNLSRLRRLHLLLVFLIVAIMLMNYKLFGLPPIFAAFGADTLDYQEYGSFRQPMFTSILVLFVSAPLEESFWRRWSLYFFAPGCFLLYSSRGYLLIMLFQALIVFSLRTRSSKTGIYAIAGTTLAAAVMISNILGNSRNSLGVEALLGYLQIKHAFYEWPAAYLWVISYISTPFSNMCWIVHVYRYDHPSLSFLSSALPGFWASRSLEAGDLGSEKIVDGVHTYMAKYFLDFWYFGILGINYVWGLIAAFISAGDRLTRNYFVSAVLLGCLGFMFFSDFLTILIIVLELVLLTLAQPYLTVPATPLGDA